MLETFRIDGVEKIQRALDANRWWQAIERHAPRAFTSMIPALKAAAPKGKTGKLSRGFDIRAKRIAQTLISGVEVDIGARVPYGHLVERGHQIIARGPGRKGSKRGVLRKALKARRLAGSQGFVPGRFFGAGVVATHGERTVSLLAKLVEQELR